MAEPITLARIAADIGERVDVSLVDRPEVMVTSVTHDSRAVGPGALFVAIVGAQSDGHDFAAGAVASGASAVLCERPIDVDAGRLVVADTRAAMPWAAHTVHGNPTRDLDVIGVTGTNGKTTVSHLCTSIWSAARRRSGLIGTLGASVGGIPVPLARTTPEATDLAALFARMRDEGVEAVVMEVSSHAMTLHRADAIDFDIVAFTNLTQDHLDFHGDMDAYFAAKAALFEAGRARRAVINVDDAYGRRLARSTQLPHTTVGSRDDADVAIVDVGTRPNGTRFTLAMGDRRLELDTPLVGRFNVCNVAMAAVICDAMGISDDDIRAGAAQVLPITGRMEVVAHDGPFTVVVDYAHTPDAISEVLRSAREIATGRVIAVVGAAGDRDPGKRSLMGAAASRFADVTVITSDNPRSEDPATIAAEVRRGVDATPGAFSVTVLDRGEAIRKAISDAATGDIVMILGKGHEQGIESDGVVIPFDDKVEAARILAELGWTTP